MRNSGLAQTQLSTLASHGLAGGLGSRSLVTVNNAYGSCDDCRTCEAPSQIRWTAATLSPNGRCQTSQDGSRRQGATDGELDIPRTR
jgi:hypothetical protein